MKLRLIVALPLLGLASVIPAPAAEQVPALSVIGAIPGPDGGWDYASVDAAQRRLYVAHGDAVMAVNLDTAKVEPKLVEGQRLHAVVPLPGGRVLSTNGGNDTATLFEGDTGRVIASIPTGRKPDAAVYDPSSGLVFVMDGQDGDATLVDPKTGTSPGRIPIGGKLEFAVADGKGNVFVNVEDKGEIAVVDAKARKVTTRYKLPDCEEPSGLAIDRKDGILVSACSNGKAIALKAADGSVLATLPIGMRPDAAIFDFKRRLFFIPCGEGTLAVIGENENGPPTVTATVPTANGARTGALDPKTGKLYLPTADFKPPAPGEKRHQVVPGTFRILIVGTK
ncbi:MAG TPA: YncE family protein [Alphaproteobacteria bacterium]|nr:YncE family protein [Alphaproteobacteria bacterium]